ncbi:hypothetical protein SAY87_029743 [Trapa incisa]|uniref:Uncharacterized protein n=1 Tax=Trapa incisa TaxID=236973 RepID=A0AAN7K876_9MYRT|nr:hypothetical protein SAY87_029743 [Trapa incisa]
MVEANYTKQNGEQGRMESCEPLKNKNFKSIFHGGLCTVTGIDPNDGWLTRVQVQRLLATAYCLPPRVTKEGKRSNRPRALANGKSWSLLLRATEVACMQSL